MKYSKSNSHFCEFLANLGYSQFDGLLRLKMCGIHNLWLSGKDTDWGARNKAKDMWLKLSKDRTRRTENTHIYRGFSSCFVTYFSRFFSPWVGGRLISCLLFPNVLHEYLCPRYRALAYPWPICMASSTTWYKSCLKVGKRLRRLSSFVSGCLRGVWVMRCMLATRRMSNAKEAGHLALLFDVFDQLCC